MENSQNKQTRSVSENLNEISIKFYVRACHID